MGCYGPYGLGPISIWKSSRAYNMAGEISVLFIGETWHGSSARSMREALQKIPEILLHEVGEDLYLPKYRGRVLRVCNRILAMFQIAELDREIRRNVAKLKPDLILVYKGSGITKRLLVDLSGCGFPLVNIFPDYSPHAYGAGLKEAIGLYDLVISTKHFHPENWKSVYNYRNKCVFVPHGYDPQVHYWAELPREQDLDVVIASSWRPEYHELLLEFAAVLDDGSVRVGVAGPGWLERRHKFPAQWSFEGARYGRAYSSWLRRGKIVIAPLNTQVVIAGRKQPGDQDTTRSYELGAAGCFFLHRRTPYIQTVYDENSEVPMWDDARELAALVKKFLPLHVERREMAQRAHLRAVPAYSIPSRAQQVYGFLHELVASRPVYPL
jgi:spore maturation protein CgeB